VDQVVADFLWASQLVRVPEILHPIQAPALAEERCSLRHLK